MRRQAVKISWGKAQYEVIHDDSDESTPFRIYYLWAEQTEYGLKRRRRQVEKCGDLLDCLVYLYDEIGRRSLTEEVVIKETFKRR